MKRLPGPGEPTPMGMVRFKATLPLAAGADAGKEFVMDLHPEAKGLPLVAAFITNRDLDFDAKYDIVKSLNEEGEIDLERPWSVRTWVLHWLVVDGLPWEGVAVYAHRPRNTMRVMVRMDFDDSPEEWDLDYERS